MRVLRITNISRLISASQYIPSFSADFVHSTINMEKPSADELFFEMWDRENRWIEETTNQQEKKQEKKQEPYRPIEQWSRNGRLVATHKSVKSITSFKPIQYAITKCCEEGGCVILLDCKPVTFCYKASVDEDVYRKTYQKRTRETSETSDITLADPAPGPVKVSSLSATDNIFSMLFP